MTSLTLVTILVAVYGAVNSRGYVRALALGGATPVGAAAVFAGEALPTFYALAFGAALALLGRVLTRTRRGYRVPEDPVPGLIPLLAMAGWAVVVTLAAPFLFDGLVLPSGARLAAGLVTSSNIAQIIYIVLSVSVVVFVARSVDVGPEVIGTMVGLVTLLSLWSYLGNTVGLPFPAGFFDNSPTFEFIATAPGGVERVRGILSEPSSLAGSSLVTIAYMLSRARQLSGARRTGALLVAAIALFLGLISTSATFFVAGVVLLGVAGLALGASVLLGRGPLSPLAVTSACAAGIAAVWLLPIVTQLLDQVISDKVASSSYEDRSGADAASFQLVLDTFGVGVGMGANRPSSFVAALLSTVGLVGAVLFAVVVGTLVRRTFHLPRYRPVMWALVAVLIPKVIAGPDLNDAGGTMWMCIGVLAHAATVAQRRSRQAAAARAAEAARLIAAERSNFAPLSSRGARAGESPPRSTEV